MPIPYIIAITPSDNFIIYINDPILLPVIFTFHTFYDFSSFKDMTYFNLIYMIL
jgi:hypothetical protein